MNKKYESFCLIVWENSLLILNSWTRQGFARRIVLLLLAQAQKFLSLRFKVGELCTARLTNRVCAPISRESQRMRQRASLPEVETLELLRFPSGRFGWVQFLCSPPEFPWKLSVNPLPKKVVFNAASPLDGQF